MRRLQFAWFLALAGVLSAQTVNPNQIRPAGTNGYILTTLGGVTTWAAPSAGAGNVTTTATLTPNFMILGAGGVAIGVSGTVSESPAGQLNVQNLNLSGTLTSPFFANFSTTGAGNSAAFFTNNNLLSGRGIPVTIVSALTANTNTNLSVGLGTGGSFNDAFFGFNFIASASHSNTAFMTVRNSSNVLSINGNGLVNFPTAPSGTCANALAQDSSGNVIAASCSAGGGGVTSISNTDGTLTIFPISGAVIASLNVAHANTWTATQTLSGLTLSGITGSTQCLQVNASGVVSGYAGPCGTSGISGLTAGYIPLAGSATTITANSHIDDGITTAATLTAKEPFVISVAGTQGGTLDAIEGTAPSAVAGHDILYADSTAHCMEYSANGGAFSCLGSAGVAFSALTSGTNTTAAMLVGTGASLAPTGTGTIQATNIASTITAGTNVTITGAGTTASPYNISSSGAGTTPVLTHINYTVAAVGKAFGTNYHNTSSFPIIVATVDGNPASANVSAFTDATTTPTTQVWNSQNFATANDPTVFVVMPGNYYRATGNSLVAWNEWTFTKGTMTQSGDLVGSRALATNYHNTGSGLMFVEVVLSGAASGDTINIASDSTTTPTTSCYTQPTVSTALSAFCLVQQGDYYAVTTSGAGVVAHWNEYSSTVTATKSRNLTTGTPQRSGKSVSGLASNTSINFPGGYSTWYAIESNEGSVGTFVSNVDTTAPSILDIQSMSSASSKTRSLVGAYMPGENLSVYTDNAANDVPLVWWEWTLQ